MINSKIEDKVSEDEDNAISLMDILLILAKHKKILFFFPLCFGLIGLIIGFMLPNIYKANTTILPPQQSQSTAAAMLSQLGGLAGSAGAALGVKNPNDIYVAMLKSRAISDKLINRFDLQKKYELKLLESTRQRFATKSTISSGKDGIINIEFEDTDQKLVALITNAYIEELIILIGELSLTEASNRRIFFEKQLLLAKENLGNAESNLNKALEQKGLISVDVQSKAILETSAKLRANITSKEIQLRSMQAFVTENNSEYKRTKQEVISMRQELAKLETGSATNEREAQVDKKGSLGNVQILRDVKYYTMLYELLAKQYEAARLDESKDIPLIQILDKAVEPERKFKPQRALMAILYSFFGLFIALTYVLIAAIMNSPKTKEEEEKWLQLKTYLKFR